MKKLRSLSLYALALLLALSFVVAFNSVSSGFGYKFKVAAEVAANIDSEYVSDVEPGEVLYTSMKKMSGEQEGVRLSVAEVNAKAAYRVTCQDNSVEVERKGANWKTVLTALEDLEPLVTACVEPKLLQENGGYERVMIHSILRSMDPHSALMTPEDFAEMKVETKGEFGGVGIQVSMKEGFLTVIAPIEDTPAQKAGLKPGDRILQIDGKPTKDKDLNWAVNNIRGPKGTAVTLTIDRSGQSMTYKLVRDIVQVKSVKAKMLEGGIGYVKLSQFQERSAFEMEKALKGLASENPRAMILDLRNNPGGLLDASVDISSMFLERGKVVVSTRGKVGEAEVYKSFGYNYGLKGPDGIPIVVLVNQGSASASEIVSGALKDWRRALVIGEDSFGKGSVQTIIPLREGYGLRLTTALYYTPSGVSIHNKGIKPDIYLKLRPTGQSEMKTILREKDLNSGDLKKGFMQEGLVSAESDVDDTQLQYAMRLLKETSGEGFGDLLASHSIARALYREAPQIAVSVKLEEPSGNGVLDAEETGKIVIKVQNSGAGDAYNLSGRISMGSNPEGLLYPEELRIGTVFAGETFTDQYKVEAGKDVHDAMASMELSITEANGFAIKPMTVSFQVKGAQKKAASTK